MATCAAQVLNAEGGARSTAKSKGAAPMTSAWNRPPNTVVVAVVVGVVEVGASVGDADGARRLRHVRAVELDVDDLHLLGAKFRGTKLLAGRDADSAWRIALAGPDVDGTVALPADLERGTVLAAFRRLVIEPLDDPGRATRADAAPGELPAFRVRIGALRLAGRDLGEVEVNTSPREGATYFPLDPWEELIAAAG